MPERYGSLALLSAMITPAVLISACGTLIFSTSNRLGRIVDRVRELGDLLQSLASSEEVEFKDERRREFDRQLSSHAVRTQLIQRALTSFYAAVGAFVATAMAIAIVVIVPTVGWLPSALGIIGILVLFYGCVLLIAEARLALRSVAEEMAFALRLSEMYRTGRRGVTP
jgi:Flp pilus assembly protein TadB